MSVKSYSKLYSCSRWSIILIYLFVLLSMHLWATSIFDPDTAAIYMSYIYGVPLLMLWVYFIWIPGGAFIFRHSMRSETMTAQLCYRMLSVRNKFPALLDRLDRKICPFSYNEKRGD